MDGMKFGEKIDLLLATTGVTESAVADVTGIAKSTITHWEGREAHEIRVNLAAHRPPGRGLGDDRRVARDAPLRERQAGAGRADRLRPEDGRSARAAAVVPGAIARSLHDPEAESLTGGGGGGPPASTQARHSVSSPTHGRTVALPSRQSAGSLHWQPW